MKKIILAGLLTTTAVMATEVKTVVPYAGTISYDSSSAKSIKDSAKFAGIYTSSGDLNHLVEFAYGYTNIKYKDGAIENLKQHDLTLKYGNFYKNFAWSAGVHYINNNEEGTAKDLGNDYTAIVGVEGYNWYGYNKLTYGVDTYYSYYNDAYTDTPSATTTNVGVFQISPRVSYSKAINISTRNTMAVVANFIYANDYKDSSYSSFEISDTLEYKKFYTTLKYNGGEMRSGVKDSGFTVYNTKDLLKSAYSAKLGYYITPKLKADISYTRNDYQEYDATYFALRPEGSSSIAVISMSYSY